MYVEIKWKVKEKYIGRILLNKVSRINTLYNLYTLNMKSTFFRDKNQLKYRYRKLKYTNIELHGGVLN